MEFGRGLLILATFMQVASADTNDTDRYTLPSSKVYIEPYQREALFLNPLLKCRKLLARLRPCRRRQF